MAIMQTAIIAMVAPTTLTTVVGTDEAGPKQRDISVENYVFLFTPRAVVGGPLWPYCWIVRKQTQSTWRHLQRYTFTSQTTPAIKGRGKTTSHGRGGKPNHNQIKPQHLEEFEQNFNFPQDNKDYHHQPGNEGHLAATKPRLTPKPIFKGSRPGSRKMWAGVPK